MGMGIDLMTLMADSADSKDVSVPVILRDYRELNGG
jgi:hypothetical protein